ncbi:hypothetical protein KI387_025128 [Taxus chinensis]|uniref:HMA domain-containing protein n=1 Tax=Taxus chinensis TaxID=29808 RepID=A0AA38G543_TAXCH|nr:hypothetical protein KI387_025128 [Taxus chinensis]
MNCKKCKREILGCIAGIKGVDSVSMDLTEKTITVIGEADPVELTKKLRKSRSTTVVSVDAVKEEKDKVEEVVSIPYSNGYYSYWYMY